MQWVRIIALSIACCVMYGILHDQITARICIEYFTIGHPPIFPTQDPTLLGVGWGVMATWWVGVLLGVPLAIVSRLGTAPARTADQLVRPMITLMLYSALFSTVMGFVGFIAALKGWVILVGDIAERVPAEKHIGFLTDLWAHSASYFAGFVGGIILMAVTWRSRRLNSTKLKTEKNREPDIEYSAR